MLLDWNVARDAENQAELRDEGWTVFVFLECEIENGTAALMALLNTRRD